MLTLLMAGEDSVEEWVYIYRRIDGEKTPKEQENLRRGGSLCSLFSHPTLVPCDVGGIGDAWGPSQSVLHPGGTPEIHACHDPTTLAGQN
jgi:hypothetical protein